MKFDKKMIWIQILALIGLGLTIKLAMIYHAANFDKYALCTLRNFMYNCQLSFLLQKNECTIEDLYDKEILVGRTGGMPALNFRNGVKLSNGDISKIDVNESIDFASLTGVFLSGVGDFVNLFELKVRSFSNLPAIKN